MQNLDTFLGSTIPGMASTRLIGKALDVQVSVQNAFWALVRWDRVLTRVLVGRIAIPLYSV